MNTLQPSIWNGPTVCGLFGHPALRHSWELHPLAAAILATPGATAFYQWLLVAPDAVCEGRFEALLLQGYFKLLPKGCGRFRTPAGIFDVILSMMICVAAGTRGIRAFAYVNLCPWGVHMSPTQFPEGYRVVVKAVERTGLREVPDAYVLLGNGGTDTYAFGHGHRRFVIVYSDLFGIGGATCGPGALRFVTNHEVGHLATERVSCLRLLAMSVDSLIPFLGTALPRIQKYTVDNYEYEGAPADAPGMTGVLSVGKCLGAQVNFNNTVDRAAAERGFWLHLVTWFTIHPILTWRMHALQNHNRPGRLVVGPPLRSALCHSSLPAGSNYHNGWLLPAWVAERLRTIELLIDEERFGRYPDRTHTTPPNTLQLSDLAGAPATWNPSDGDPAERV